MPLLRTCVIVPTYNERSTIGDIVTKLFTANPDGVDLLVVDDSSPDGTADEVARLAREETRISLLTRTQKDGLGKAYIAGFRWALERDYEAVVEMDADLSHDPAAVPALLEALTGADLAVGSRYVPGGRIENWGVARRALSRLGNIYARTMLNIGVRDSTSGFRAFRASTLKAIDLDSVASHGYAFQIEMVRRVHRDRGRIVEIPITFVERAAGASKMSKRIVAEALWEVTMWGIRDRLLDRKKNL